MMATFLCWWSPCAKSAFVPWPRNGQSPPVDLCLESIKIEIKNSPCTFWIHYAKRSPTILRTATQVHSCQWYLTRYVISLRMRRLKKKLNVMESPIFTSEVCIPVKTRSLGQCKTIMTRMVSGIVGSNITPTFSSPMWMKLLFLFMCGNAVIVADACLPREILVTLVLAFRSIHTF